MEFNIEEYDVKVRFSPVSSSNILDGNKNSGL